MPLLGRDAFDELMVSHRQRFGPVRLSLRYTCGKALFDAVGIPRIELLHAPKTYSFGQILHIEQPVSLTLATEFVVSALRPLAWVIDFSGADHIQINIAEAIDQVPTVLDDRTLVRMLPHGVHTLISQIVPLGNGSRGKMHEAANGLAAIRVRDYVDVVACDAVGIYGYLEPKHALA